MFALILINGHIAGRYHAVFFCFGIRDFLSAFPCFNGKIDATLSRAFSNSSMVSPTVFLIDFKLSRSSSFALGLNLWPD